MAISERQLLDTLSSLPFVDSTKLTLILGEPHATVHRTLSTLLAEGIVGRVSHGATHLTANGIREAAEILGFATPSASVRAYPMSREWLTLLLHRMDAVASVYRLAASLSPGIDRLRSRGGVPPQGTLRRHHHAARQAHLGVVRALPCGAGPSTTG